MKTSKLLALLSTLALSSTFAAETDPVGYVSVTVPANSDAVLAVPLNRAAEFKGVISSISGNVITVAGTPAWTNNQFAPLTTANKTYALQLATGAKEGMIGKVTGNTLDTVTVQLDSGDDFSGVVAGDQVDIMPYWTPGSLLGTSITAGTELMSFEGAGAGINKAATKIYGATGSSWEDGETGGDATHAPLAFGYAFVLRNNSASSLAVSFVGSVPMTASRIRLSTLGSNLDQDLRVGFMSPVPESINSLNIPAAAGDIIFGFNNAATGKNKAAATTYAYDGTKWVNDETGEPLTSEDKLQPGFGYLFRKFRTANPTSVVWQKTPSYLQ